MRDPSAAFPLAGARDDAAGRRAANRAVGASAVGLAITGLAELALALLTGSAGLLGDAIHNLSDVSVQAGRRPPHRVGDPYRRRQALHGEAAAGSVASPQSAERLSGTALAGTITDRVRRTA